MKTAPALIICTACFLAAHSAFFKSAEFTLPRVGGGSVGVNSGGHGCGSAVSAGRPAYAFAAVPEIAGENVISTEPACMNLPAHEGFFQGGKAPAFG